MLACPRLWLPLCPMVIGVLARSHESKVRQIVIERVVVDVVDNVLSGNRPMRLFPNSAVQRAAMRPIIDAPVPPRMLWPAVIGFPVE